MRQRISRSRLIGNIDVSALAAVLFVLLFAFMMLTSTPHYGVSADLPKVLHPIALRGANREDALIVSVLRDGTMYFGNYKTKPSDLPTQIREGVRRGAENRVYIRADARVRYRTVLKVLDAIRSAGVEKIAFLAYQRSATPAKL